MELDPPECAPDDTSAPEIKALRKSSGSSPANGCTSCNSPARVKERWLAELKAKRRAGRELLPENAYLVYGDAAALARLQSLGGGIGVHAMGR